MAYVTQTLVTPALTARLQDLKNTVVTAFNNRRTYNTTVAELETLSTRELNDLGIVRSDIHRLAREAAYGV